MMSQIEKIGELIKNYEIDFSEKDEDVRLYSCIVYVATELAKQERWECAEEAWKVLIANGIGWELRKAVTDAIHARDEK
jgi:hypothetical protein